VTFCAATAAPSVGTGCAAAAVAAAGIVVVAGVTYVVKKPRVLLEQAATSPTPPNLAFAIAYLGVSTGWQLATASETVLGGSYTDTKGGTLNGIAAQGHHVIAKAAVKAVFGTPRPGCGEFSQTTVKMEKPDHALTKSNGNSLGSQAFQKLQQDLLLKSDFEGAFKLGIKDIMSVDKLKYAEGIQAAWEHFDNWLKKCGPDSKGGGPGIGGPLV
jgi:hypothetical protein